MTRLVAIGAGLLLVGTAALFAVVLWLVDPETLGPLLEAEIERATAGEATLGEVEFSLFPLPALSVRDLKLSQDGEEILTANSIRVRVSLFSALVGQVVLTALELEDPVVRLALDEAGRPVIPLASANEDGSAPGREAASAPALAIRRLAISGGTLELGPWRLENIELEGSLGVDLAASFSGQLDIAGIGALREQQVRIRGLLGRGDVLEVEAKGELLHVDLVALARHAGAEVDALRAGSLSGSYEVQLSGAKLDSADIEGVVADLLIESGGVHVAGDVPFRARPGERWRLDLSAAQVEVEGALAKPPNAELALSGADLDDLRLHLAGNEVPLLLADGGVLRAGPAIIELEALGAWLVDEGRLAPQPDERLRGRLVIESLELRTQPLELAGSGSLDAIELALQHGSVSVTGPWAAAGSLVSGAGLQLGVGGQAVAIDVAYDLASGSLDVSAAAAGAEVEPMLRALRGSAELTGTLSLDAQVKGPPDPAGLLGSGRFEIREGELRGFSVMQQVLGELARFPIVVAAIEGKDLSKYDEERFESLGATFTLSDGRIHVRPLVAVYRGGEATLWGTIGLADGALDLHGHIELSREMDEELSGQRPKEPTVIPIEGVRGTVSKPRVRVDRAALAGVATTLATRGKLGRDLEEKLGPGAAEAVQQIFDQLLRKGGR